MKISEAIMEARKTHEWPVTNYDPTSVNVGFVSDSDPEDETQLDLWGNTPEKREKELEELWNSLCKEFESGPDKILYVEAIGYIAD